MSGSKRLAVELGGSGNKAPYKTSHVRVPLPIKKSVEEQIRAFKERLSSGDVVIDGKGIYEQIPIEKQVDYEVIIEVVNDFLMHHSRVAVDSPRNANLLNFINWIQDKRTIKG